MAYECSSEQVKSFGFANRMMLEMLGCTRGYKVRLMALDLYTAIALEGHATALRASNQ